MIKLLNILSEIKIEGNKWYILYNSLFPENEEDGEYLLSEKAKEILLKYNPDDEGIIDEYLNSNDFDNAELYKTFDDYNWKEDPKTAYKEIVRSLLIDYDFYNGNYDSEYDIDKIDEIKIVGNIWKDPNLIKNKYF